MEKERKRLQEAGFTDQEIEAFLQGRPISEVSPDLPELDPNAPSDAQQRAAAQGQAISRDTPPLMSMENVVPALAAAAPYALPAAAAGAAVYGGKRLLDQRAQQFLINQQQQNLSQQQLAQAQRQLAESQRFSEQGIRERAALRQGRIAPGTPGQFGPGTAMPQQPMNPPAQAPVSQARPGVPRTPPTGAVNLSEMANLAQRMRELAAQQVERISPAARRGMGALGAALYSPGLNVGEDEYLRQLRERAARGELPR